MQQDVEHIELVRRALAGDEVSLSHLTELAQGRVCAYVRRVVLDEERAQDLTQEAIVAMLSSGNQLRDPSRFWSWLFSIVNNKLRLFYRRRDYHPKVFSDHPTAWLNALSAEPPPLEGLARDELVTLTRSALGEIDLKYRMVLAMRFYEDMPHSAIGTIMGCSETTARVTFLRAKKALLHALRKRGIRDAALGVALLAFGEATRSTAAATVSVSAAAVAESTRYLLLSKFIPAATALLALVVFVSSMRQPPAGLALPTTASPVLSVHFIEQSDADECQMYYQNTPKSGAYELWYRFPEGSRGPLLSRVQLWNSALTVKDCWWLQDENANYHVLTDGRVTINNGRLSSRRVRLLPTDSDEFIAFVRDVENHTLPWLTATRPSPQIVERDAKTGFVQTKLDYHFPQFGPFETKYDYAPLSASLFELPRNLKVTDERDEMHTRGWTWFRVSGQLGGHKVSGTGQIPFGYAAYKTHPPWLHLAIEGRGEVYDTVDGACMLISNASGMTRSDYPKGSFWSGLSRPWSGLHTADVIRRDAAMQQLWFETGTVQDARVSLDIKIMDHRFNPPRVGSYRVDLEHDVLHQFELGIEGVSFQTPDTLDFYYVQNIELLDEPFTAPVLPKASPTASFAQGPGPLWPFMLMQGVDIQASDASTDSSIARNVNTHNNSLE